MESKYQEALNYLVNNCYDHDSWNDDNESIANLQELIDNYGKLEKAFNDACEELACYSSSKNEYKNLKRKLKGRKNLKWKIRK